MKTRHVGRLQRRAERGGAVMIVAILLGGGVLLGSAALAIDVGNMMFERRQLQNGADATAYKLAQICGKDPAQCDATTTLAELNPLNEANASDSLASLNGLSDAALGTLNGQCGRVPGAANLPPCDSDAADADVAELGECPPLPDWVKDDPDVKYVETYTLTKYNSGSGETHLLPSFFQVSDGAAVGACSRYAWGAAKGTGVLPLTFSECEWNDATSGGTVYGVEVALATNYNKDALCAVYNGHDYPGGFGWLDHAPGDCEVQADENDWVPGWPGNGTGNDCLPTVDVGDILHLPIFDCVNDDKNFCPNETIGSKTNYHLAGMAAFQVTAIDLTGKTEGTPGAAAKAECKDDSNNKQCIYGMFLEDLTPVGEVDTGGGGTDYGLSVVKPAG